MPGTVPALVLITTPPAVALTRLPVAEPEKDVATMKTTLHVGESETVMVREEMVTLPLDCPLTTPVMLLVTAKSPVACSVPALDANRQ